MFNDFDSTDEVELLREVDGKLEPTGEIGRPVEWRMRSVLHTSNIGFVQVQEYQLRNIVTNERFVNVEDDPWFPRILLTLTEKSLKSKKFVNKRA